MSSLVRSVTIALLVCAGPLLAAPVPTPPKYEPPTAVGQLASVAKLLETVLGYAKAFSPESATSVEKGLADLLGEKGWAGLDTAKPVGVYVYAKPKLEDSTLFFVFPVTKEKDALDLLERLGVGVEEDAKAKGVYRLTHRSLLPENSPTRMRFHAGHAYVGINADADELEPAKLLPAAQVIDAKETALAAVTAFPGRAPAELKEMTDGWWASAKAGLNQLENQAPRDMPKGFPAFAKACVSWVEANSAALFKDAETATVRLTPDPKTTDAALEVVVTPKAKSQLAADIAKLEKLTPGRFHQLVTKDATGGLTMTLGTGLNKEVRTTAGPFLADWLAQLGHPDAVEPVVTAIGQAVSKMIADGTTDLGVAMLGPDKDAAYTLIAAAAVADPAALEKAVRKLVKDLPDDADAKKMIKLDAEKVGDVSVHTMTLPEGTEAVFGKKPTVRVAFGKDAVYVAVGPDGPAQLKRAMELKPADGKRFDLLMNPKKANKLIADLSGGPNGGAGAGWVDVIIGQEDGLRSFTGLDVKGGKELKVTLSQHRTGLLFGMFGFMAFRVGGGL
jgi:hypothetical protein